MIKSELIDKMTNQMRMLSDTTVEAAINHILEQMSHALSHGQRVEIRGFGSLSLHFRASRIAHNPKNKQKVSTKPKYIPHFKPGKELRERVNNAYLNNQQTSHQNMTGSHRDNDDSGDGGNGSNNNTSW